MSMQFNIADLFESVVDVIPDKVALVSGDVRLTYKQLDDRANRVAHYLQSIGVGRGDHIGLYLYNGNPYIELMLGAMKIGAVTININYRYVAEELKYLLTDSDSKALFFQQELIDEVVPIIGQCDKVTTLVVCPDESDKDLSALPSAQLYESAIWDCDGSRDFEPRSPDDRFIIYTGGTTGMPKGVVWRQEDLFFAGLQGGNPSGDDIERPEDLAAIAKEGDLAIQLLAAPPLIHGTSQFASLIAFFGGGKVVYMPRRGFDAAECCRLIGAEEIGVLVLIGDAMVRPFVDELSENKDDYDMGSLFVMTSQSAVLSQSTRDRLKELLPYTMIMNNFGSSETGHQGRALPKMDDDDDAIRFMMTDSTVLLDDEMNRIEPGSDKIGRLARRGRLPQGYYKDATKTGNTFVTIDGERYALLGDYATIDEAGFVTLLGRGSVCINTGGEKVFPEEVEIAVKNHPSVDDCTIVGVPDARWGSRVEALVTLRKGATASGDELAQHTRGHVAGYKVPKTWHIVDEIQRHPSGKPDYRWAKERAIKLGSANG